MVSDWNLSYSDLSKQRSCGRNFRVLTSNRARKETTQERHENTFERISYGLYTLLSVVFAHAFSKSWFDSVPGFR
jgi:hypothetical protein